LEIVKLSNREHGRTLFQFSLQLASHCKRYAGLPRWEKPVSEWQHAALSKCIVSIGWRQTGSEENFGQWAPRLDGNVTCPLRPNHHQRLEKRRLPMSDQTAKLAIRELVESMPV
jgi:hypothetical protein